MSELSIHVRPADGADLDAVLALQAENFVGRMSPEAKRDGFLSAEFTRMQFEQMRAGLGIDAAFDDNRLVGYLCASRCTDTPRPPISKAMIDAFARCRYDGAPLDERTCYLYGPVCIAPSHRGGDILHRLFTAQRMRMAAHFSTGAAFIAHDNPRSLRAHTAKLGMTQAGTFEWSGNVYHVVAFSTRDPRRSG